MSKLKFIGGILLIVGTSIGGGMLALPIVNAETGFWQSSLTLFIIWALMTQSAFYFLEANFYLPPGKNIISMAANTLGKPGLIFAWLSYLFLLYALLCAYISGGGDMLGSIYQKISNHSIPQWQTNIVFTLLFGLFVYAGIRKVDLLNRLLMFGKLIIYCLLILLFVPFITPTHYQTSNFPKAFSTLTVLITSYGFAIIIPNLREYFQDDIKALKKIIWIGSLIPLICYIAWDAVIIGCLGNDKLNPLIISSRPTSNLANILSATVNNNFIALFFNVFTSICMLTAFLGVSLCLMSFFADGTKLTKHRWEGLALFMLTFLPSLIIVIFFPGVYILALSYAGIFCIILLLILPTFMTLVGRKKFLSPFFAYGGKATQITIIIVSILLLSNAIYQLF